MAVNEVITDFWNRAFGLDRVGNAVLKGGAYMSDAAGSLVTVTAATLAVTQAAHAERTVVLSRAAGIAVTLPAATGTGARYRFIVGTAVTSGAITIAVADASDTMAGNALQAAAADNTMSMFEAGATADTITLNGSTTGGLKGDSVELIDIAADTWWVRVVGAATGVQATPFSAAV